MSRMSVVSPLSLSSKFIPKKHHLTHITKTKETRITSHSISTNSKINYTEQNNNALLNKTNQFPNRNKNYLHITKAQFEVTAPVFFELDTSLWAPAIKGSIDILVSLILAFAITKLVRYLAAYDINGILKPERSKGIRKQSEIIRQAIFSRLDKPVSIVLPILVLIHSVRVILCRSDQILHLRHATECKTHYIDGLLHMILDVVRPIDEFLSLVVKVVLVAIGTWVLICLKEAYIVSLMEKQAKSDPVMISDWRRLVSPLNSVATYLLIGIGVVSAAGVLGWNIQPILTFGSVGGIVVGLAAQSVFSNIIAGINLFISRPFLDGDRIDIYSSSGNNIYSGTVERINPLRTIIRTDELYPIAVPNKVLSDLVIGNESRFVTTHSSSYKEGSRRFYVKLNIPIEYFEQVEKILASINILLRNFKAINHGMPFGASISAMDEKKFTLTVQGTTSKEEKIGYDEFRVNLLLNLKNVLSSTDVNGYQLSF